MKYIRTKDGIYEVDIISIHYLGETHFSCWDIKHTKAFNDWHIIKQAGTIEELCDEYVVKHINMLTPMLIDKFTISLKEIKTQYSGNDNFEYIYGAIWTDKGLIYVAKLNENGDLELL